MRVSLITPKALSTLSQKSETVAENGHSRTFLRHCPWIGLNTWDMTGIRRHLQCGPRSWIRGRPLRRGKGLEMEGDKEGKGADVPCYYTRKLSKKHNNTIYKSTIKSIVCLSLKSLPVVKEIINVWWQFVNVAGVKTIKHDTNIGSCLPVLHNVKI